ncbi:Lrp/AsnC family transcriptional regulator [Amycolatopsis rhizosphaerae]|uniref:Lrp/AsnC family transcriptional regulator n=1 Tax=Amycolatopsis rhizosphaerae TaxID=2053003 RepID=A0A558A8T7_9PSEU|nr:Lrp/AsnC family transcriptional regulator [Amycolatopsis rhizosphaerae]TVT20663.1 Lrp/AsnC family transcriptional regulator [Amycolatopsis rhizosphaerae]
MPAADLDQLDLAILSRLQEDSRTIAESIGAQVGLSAAAVQRRIKRLREAGVISREVAVIDPKAVGVDMTFVVSVEMERERIDVLDAFRKQVLADPVVQQCYYVTGSADFMLLVTCRDMTAFEAFTRRTFFENEEVRHFTTSVVMDRVKVGLGIPLTGG